MWYLIVLCGCVDPDYEVLFSFILICYGLIWLVQTSNRAAFQIFKCVMAHCRQELSHGC
jgi:hypothetical protein